MPSFSKPERPAKGPEWFKYANEVVGRVVLGKPGIVGVVQGLNLDDYRTPRHLRVRTIKASSTFSVRFIYTKTGDFYVEQTMSLEALLLLCSNDDEFVPVNVWSQNEDVLDAQQTNWHPLPAGFVRTWTQPPLDQLRSTLRTLADMEVPLPRAKAPAKAKVPAKAVAEPEAPAQPAEAMDVDEDEAELAAKNAKKAARNAKEAAARKAKKAAKPEAPKPLK